MAYKGEGDDPYGGYSNPYDQPQTDPNDPYGYLKAARGANAPIGADENAFAQTGFYTDSPGAGIDNYGRPIPGYVPPYQPQAPSGSSGGGTYFGGGSTVPIGQGLLSPYSGSAMPTPPSASTSYLPPTPNYTAPQFNAPSYQKPPAFELPTFEQAENDPGYQFTRRQGQRGLEQSAAARGLLNTGGTAKDLINYNQAAATTQYGNVLNRLLNQYMTNYQTQFVDPYQIAFQGAQAEFAPQMAGFQANVGAGNLGYSTQAAAGQRGQEFNYSALWDQYLQNINNFRDTRDSTWNKAFQFQTAE